MRTPSSSVFWRRFALLMAGSAAVAFTIRAAIDASVLRAVRRRTRQQPPVTWTAVSPARQPTTASPPLSTTVRTGEATPRRRHRAPVRH